MKKEKKYIEYILKQAEALLAIDSLCHNVK